jgi:hypothetical protein
MPEGWRERRFFGVAAGWGILRRAGGRKFLGEQAGEFLSGQEEKFSRPGRGLCGGEGEELLEAAVGIEEFGAEGDGVERRSGGELGAGRCGEADEIFFGGEEEVGVGGGCGRGDAGEVGGGIAMVVGEGEGGGGGEVARVVGDGAERGEEFFGAGDAGEGERTGGGGKLREVEGAAEGPENGAAAGGTLEEVEKIGSEGGVGFGEDENVGAGERAMGLAEISGGEEDVGEVGGGEEDDVGVAGELAVLESVVEKEDGGGGERLRLGREGLRGEGLRGEEADLIAIGANEDGGWRGSGEEEGLVAEGGGVSGGVDAGDVGGLAAVSAGEDDGEAAGGGEELGEGEDQGSFSGASGREIADAEDGEGERICGEDFAVVERVAQGGGSGVERVEGKEQRALHLVASILDVAGGAEEAAAGGAELRSERRAARVRAVAPVFSERTAWARRPCAVAAMGSRRRMARVGARFSAVAMVRAWAARRVWMISAKF